ncbi:MAG: ABC transporter transmembrane domain-containing protein, partial [Deefgea sp.]
MIEGNSVIIKVYLQGSFHYMNSKQLYFRVLSYILPYRSVAIMSILAMVVAGGVDAAMIKMIGVVIDSFKQSKAVAHAAWVMPMILFGMGLLRLISSFAYEYGSAWLSSRVMHDLRQEVFERMMAMPIRFFDQASVGVLLSRVTYDINQIMDAGLNVLTVLVKDSVMAIALLGVMFWTDWQLTLFCLIMLPGAAVSIQIVSKRQRRLSRETQDMMGEMSQILDESLGGQR